MGAEFLHLALKSRELDRAASSVLYTTKNNDLLHVIEESGIGATIGCLYCRAPTCADDVAVLGVKMHAQCIVTIVRWYCGGHRYCIHPQKSEEVPMKRMMRDQSLRLWMERSQYQKFRVRYIRVFIGSPLLDETFRRKFSWAGVQCIAWWELVFVVGQDWILLFPHIYGRYTW